MGIEHIVAFIIGAFAALVIRDIIVSRAEKRKADANRERWYRDEAIKAAVHDLRHAVRMASVKAGLRLHEHLEP